MVIRIPPLPPGKVSCDHISHYKKRKGLCSSVFRQTPSYLWAPWCRVLYFASALSQNSR